MSPLFHLQRGPDPDLTPEESSRLLRVELTTYAAVTAAALLWAWACSLLPLHPGIRALIYLASLFLLWITGLAIAARVSRLNVMSRRRSFTTPQAILAAIATGGACAGTLYGAPIAAGVPLVNFASLLLPMGLAITGGMLAALGVRGRVPTPRSCSRCHYPAPEEDRRICPECGSDLWRPGATTRSARRPRAVLIFAGLLIGAPAAALLIVPFRIVHLAGAMPAPVLRHAAVRNDDLWPDLEARGIDPASAPALAEDLLDARLQWWGGGHDAGMDWFERQRLAGSLPEDLERRYFEESTRPRLDVPRRVRPGERFEARLGGDEGSLGGGLVAQLAVRFSVNGQVVSQTEHTVPSFYLDFSAPIIPRVEGLREAPKAEIEAPDAPGRLLVRACVVRLALPGMGAGRIGWRDDGSVDIPPGAVWHDVIELERVIEVR